MTAVELVNIETDRPVTEWDPYRPDALPRVGDRIWAVGAKWNVESVTHAPHEDAISLMVSRVNTGLMGDRSP